MLNESPKSNDLGDSEKANNFNHIQLKQVIAQVYAQVLLRTVFFIYILDYRLRVPTVWCNPPAHKADLTVTMILFNNPVLKCQ